MLKWNIKYKLERLVDPKYLQFQLVCLQNNFDEYMASLYK